MSRRRPITAMVLAIASGLISACATTAAPPEAAATPRLVLEDYFLGQTTAWGVVQNRAGTLQRQFRVDITGTWDGQALVLDEQFLYSDGARETRVWTLRKTGTNTWAGTAGDVIGVANGRVDGNQLAWVYDINLNMDGRPLRVTFDDRMWLQPDGVLINRAKIKKFGITWGEVLIAFSKDEDQAQTALNDADAVASRMAAQ
jgi:Protein of unknown function (DUF3833)